jgi:hypothetical protein
MDAPASHPRLKLTMGEFCFASKNVVTPPPHYLLSALPGKGADAVRCQRRKCFEAAQRTRRCICQAQESVRGMPARLM